MTRKLAILVVLLTAIITGLPSPAEAAAPPDGFMGIAWGANQQQVKKAMSERGFVFLSEDKKVIKFKGEFAGNTAELKFLMTNGAFFEGWADYMGRAVFVPGVQDKFREVVKLITEKYGPPTKSGARTYPGIKGSYEDYAWEFAGPEGAGPTRIVCAMVPPGPYWNENQHEAYFIVYYVSSVKGIDSRKQDI